MIDSEHIEDIVKNNCDYNGSHCKYEFSFLPNFVGRRKLENSMSEKAKSGKRRIRKKKEKTVCDCFDSACVGSFKIKGSPSRRRL